MSLYLSACRASSACRVRLGMLHLRLSHLEVLTQLITLCLKTCMFVFTSIGVSRKLEDYIQIIEYDQ